MIKNKDILNMPKNIQRMYALTPILTGFRSLPDPIAAWKEFCNGMDEYSIEIATRSLSMIDLISSKVENAYSLEDLKKSFDPKELEAILTPKELETLRTNNARKASIFKVSDNCWAFGKYMLPIRHFETSVFIDKHGLQTLKTEPKKDSVIIDVGGFIGDSVLILRDFFKNKIYTFEASKDNFLLLNKTIDMNNVHNVFPVQSALTDRLDKDLYFSENKGSSNFTVSKKGGEKLSVDTLDNFVSKNKLNVGLIKVDIEGGEQDFLLGARKTITRDTPILLLSIYHPWTNLDYFNIKKLIESWDLGYKFHLFKPMDSNFVYETLLICEQG